MKRILVTGCNGYIGPHLIELLMEYGGFHVIGCDLNLFAADAWQTLPRPDEFYLKDFRDLTEQELRNVDSIVHLAAISNDPMGDLDESLTNAINGTGTIRFAKLCEAAGVNTFLMSSSCSIYGKTGADAMIETDETEPLTAYARSKILVEDELSKMASNDFCVSFLRNATAYGHSANLRVDLVVNNFLACVAAFNEIRIMSDGSPWRPLIHCKDIARAFLYFLNAESDAINNQIVNIGSNSQNFQVKQVADLVKQINPNCEILMTGELAHDSRDYKVNFDKLATIIPDFELEYDLQTGMNELSVQLQDYGFGASDFEGNRFVRLRSLQKQMKVLNGTH